MQKHCSGRLAWLEEVLVGGSVLGRPGSDLLSHALRRSTIGAEGFHGRVRDGIGCGALAITTRPAKNRAQSSKELGSEDRAQSYRQVERGCGTSRGRAVAIGGGGSVLCPPISVVWQRAVRCAGVFRVSLLIGCLAPAPKGWHEKSIKPIERLVPVSSMHCCTSTSGLSTWSSSTALKRDLVSRGASRLDAFSGYPVRT